MTEEEQQFRSTTEHKSVLGLVTEFNNKQIDLNAKYQRDIIWKDEQKTAFINSVHRGIVPNNLIFCKDEENNKLMCIDGKQRITSLIEYIKNKIPLILEANEKEMIYYDKIPTEQETGKTYRTMTAKEKGTFDNRSIPIVKYDHLTYEDQVDIFSRIQKGAKLTPGELILSIFQSDKACEIFNDFCETKKELVNRYVKQGKDRKGHVLLITHLTFLLESENDDIPEKSHLQPFLRKYDRMNDMRKLVKDIGPQFDIYFSDSLFNHSLFTKKLIDDMSKNVFYALFLCFKNEEYKICEMNNKQINKLRKVILATIKSFNNNHKKTMGNKKANTIAKIYDIFKQQNDKIEESDDESDNNDDGEDSLSEKDYTPLTIKKKVPAKKSPPKTLSKKEKIIE